MADATMIRSTLSIGEITHLLAQGQDLGMLRSQIEQAVHEGGRFIEFTAVGNRTVFALITGREQVTFTLEAVPFDARDDGDLDYPFGGHFDII